MLNQVDVSTGEFIQDYFGGLKSVMDALPAEDVRAFIQYLADAYQEGRRVFIIGNGGSAATASHMACDLSKTVLGSPINTQLKRFAAIALTDNVPALTAWANDVNYDLVFAEQLRNLTDKDDLLVVITGSGNSPNIVEAVRVARELGMKSIGMLGFDGGSVKSLLDHSIIVNSRNYGYIEDAHMVLTHLLTAYFKKIFEE
jgi:D-sedoheptulose 7-phosphate isomerase